MSTATATTERAKLTYILELSREQVHALEADDFSAFDRILAAKRSLIAGLTEARHLVTADPALASVVSAIREADGMAQRLLYRKVGRVMRELNELNQYKRARGAYASRLSAFPGGLSPDASRFMDRKS